MNSKILMSSLDTLPVIIDGTGVYITRLGQLVKITKTAGDSRQMRIFVCGGTYVTSQTDEVDNYWHKSGRLHFGSLSHSDIVRKVS